MTLPRGLTRFGMLASVALFASGAFAGEQHLELKLVIHPLDVKVVEAPNVAGEKMTSGKYFGVAWTNDGRVAVKDYIGASDMLNGTGSLKGYSTYTFQDGSSITASYTGEIKEGVVHGEYKILSGTGLYDKATGSGTFDNVPTKWTDGATLLNVKFDVKTP
jgi:hypothetical protein